MRVTAGSMKGRKVCTRGVGGASAHGALRPTSSKVRQALFNIIGPSIEGAVFADLYSGTGTVGMEAMSRQAETVYFVEADRSRAQALRETIGDCGCASHAVFLCMSAVDFMKKMAAEGKRLDIIFMDPPYDSPEIETLLPVIGSSPALAEDVRVIVEHRKDHHTAESCGALYKRKEYRYGDTHLSLYENEVMSEEVSDE